MINIIWSIKIKFCIDDKDVNDYKDDKDNNNVDNDNDDNDDEYNDINEHLVKLESDKPDQSNEVNDNKTDFQGLDHLLKDLFCILQHLSLHQCTLLWLYQRSQSSNIWPPRIPSRREKLDHAEAPYFSPISEILLTLNKE